LIRWRIGQPEQKDGGQMATVFDEARLPTGEPKDF
jgi:hypothetical protein